MRQPIKENVKDFHWFPNKNIIITVTEKRNKKGSLDESILSFYEVKLIFLRKRKQIKNFILRIKL